MVAQTEARKRLLDLKEAQAKLLELKLFNFMNKLRDNLKYSDLEAVASESGIPSETIHSIMDGTETDPKTSVIIALCAAHGKNLVYWDKDWYMSGMEEPWELLRS